MLVVADTSPLIVLAKIDALHVLPDLFHEVFATSQVFAELAAPHRPDPVRRLSISPPTWLIERNPRSLGLWPGLHGGEQAAISLAIEINADLLLIDETPGRRTARGLGLPLTGTIGVLELAADAELIDLPTAFSRVKQTDFWIGHAFLDERLRLFLSRHRSNP
jgi:predicted nucleic acid-binding protein